LTLHYYLFNSDNSKLVNYKKNREYALGLLPIDVREKVSERTKRSLAKFATETNKKKASSFSLGEMEKSLKGLCFPDRLLRKAATIQKCVEQIILRQDPLISNALQEVGVRVVKVTVYTSAIPRGVTLPKGRNEKASSCGDSLEEYKGARV
jgi:hypothetical protein